MASALPQLPGQLTGGRQAPSLLPFSPTLPLLGSLVNNTATKNLVEKTTKYISLLSQGVDLITDTCLES